MGLTGTSPRRPAAVGLAALALTLGAGCSGESESDAKGAGPTTSAESASTEPAPNIVQPGAPGETTKDLTPDELDDIEAPPHTQADVEFMQDMIHHHQQALTMASYVPERAAGRGLRLFAKRMALSQEDEIALMARWLRARDEEPFAVHDASERMPGMLSDAELETMKNATGRDFNRLFVQGMLRHHQGALTMVDRLYTNPGSGLEPELDSFARHVVADQTIEIGRLRTMLAELQSEDQQ